jgi:hypothetical protein
MLAADNKALPLLSQKLLISCLKADAVTCLLSFFHHFGTGPVSSGKFTLLNTSSYAPPMMITLHQFASQNEWVLLWRNCSCIRHVCGWPDCVRWRLVWTLGFHWPLKANSVWFWFALGGYRTALDWKDLFSRPSFGCKCGFAETGHLRAQACSWV